MEDSNAVDNRSTYNRIDLSKLSFGKTISSDEALKDVIIMEWEQPDAK